MTIAILYLFAFIWIMFAFLRRLKLHEVRHQVFLFAILSPSTKINACHIVGFQISVKYMETSSTNIKDHQKKMPGRKPTNNKPTNQNQQTNDPFHEEKVTDEIWYI